MIAGLLSIVRVAADIMRRSWPMSNGDFKAAHMEKCALY
jgi:hypothetical protein